MTMKDYYMMSITDGCTLRDTVKEQGEVIAILFNDSLYRNTDIIAYNGDTYEVDCILGIIDINNTAKDLPL